MTPRPGGETAKVGERYENRWTVHELLRILEGRAVSITVEELGEAGTGIEFALLRNDGVTEAHQVKRQHGSANRWTIRQLDEAGVLTAAAAQIERGREFHFISVLPSQRLSDMTDRARGADDFGTFLGSLNKEQAKDLKSLEVLAGGAAEAFALLRSLFVRWPDERHVEDVNASRAGSLIGGAPGPAAALTLGDIVRENLGVTLNSPTIREKLRKYELEVIDLAKADGITDTTVRTAYESWENSFAGELLEPEIPRAEAEEIIAELEAGEHRTVLVAGPAGAGKSAVLHQVVRDLAERWPVLPLRLDLIEPFSSTHELGVERLGLPASPATSLAAFAGDQDCLLVVDQLDIVSRASGRMPATFDAVANLLREATAYPNMRVLAACRQFDLDNDDRLRQLTTDRNRAVEFDVPPLSDEEVEDAVFAMGFELDALTPEQWELMRSPLHLVLLHAIADEGNALDFATSKDLLDAFWDEKRRVCRIRRETRFADTIGVLTDYMSANQQLAAPEAILDEGDLLDDADVLTSEHVLVRNGGRIAFFHEAFFDYAFARRWIIRDEGIVEFLRSGEQELFRRAQVRQVLTHLRESDPDRFVAEVDALLESADVRSHLKDVVFGILRALPDPSADEWQLLERQLQREPPFACQLWSVLGTSAWFLRLDDEGVLERWLASEDSELQDHALKIMASVPDHEADRLIELLSPYAGGPELDELAQRMISAVGYWNMSQVLRRMDEAADSEVFAALERERDKFERDLEAGRAERTSESKEIASPIPAAEANAMSDADWLRAIAEYGHEHDGLSPIGGAEELARVLEEQTSSDPSRFAGLCLSLDVSTHPVYVNGILHGLGVTRVEVDPRLVFDAVRHAAALGREEHDYAISRAVRSHLSDGAPDDIVELLLNRALHSPDPPDSSNADTQGDKHYKYNRHRMAQLTGGWTPGGEGGARGQACEALADLLSEDPDGPSTSIVVNAFPELASEPVVEVLSCIARLFIAGLGPAPDAVVAAFPRLIEGDDRLLACHPVRRLITDIGEPDLVRPVIERMLTSENADVREAGGELAAFAAAELGFDELLARTSSADIAVRKGAAYGCAERLPTAKDSEATATALRQFFDDQDPDVRNAAGWVAGSLGEGRLEDHVELVKALIASPTFGHAFSELLNTLEMSGDSDELVLLTARRFLDLFGGRLDSISSLGEAADTEKLGELVTRAYSQAPDAESRGRILDLIDELLEAGAYGFSDLVGGAER